MPRFVLLRHDCPPDFERASHWDLMLESGNALRTWALANLPSSSCDSVDVEELGEHRLAYLEYEGPISGNRGTVSRIDAGTFATIYQTKDCWRLRLDGRLLCGTLALQRATENRWTLTYGPQA